MEPEKDPVARRLTRGGGSQAAANNLVSPLSLKPEDYASAKQQFERAAATGDADAMNNLGALYNNGIGVPQGLHPSERVVRERGGGRKSLGHVRSGFWCENGNGVSKDHT
jgi:hypothetical protein